MNIGIDIDGVLINDDDYMLATLTKYCVDNNLDYLENPLGYENRKMKNWTKEIDLDYIEKFFWNYVENEPPRKYASEVIDMLKKEGHNIYIITSRKYCTWKNEIGDKLRNLTIKWMQNNKIAYNEIYFSEDKTEQIRNLKIDIMIEDSPITIPKFTKFTHVFCYDCRYNTELSDKNITRVFSWYDIYQKIKAISSVGLE